MRWLIPYFFGYKTELHGPPMLVDKTNFGLVLYKLANFYRFEESSIYRSVKRISVCLCFSLVNKRHTSGITVYNHTVTNIGNTMRAVHSCNSWFSFQSNPKNSDPSYKKYLDLLDCLGRVKLVFVAKFHRTDLVTCSHSREGKPRLIAG